MVYSAAPSKPALSSLRIHVKTSIRDWFESDFTTGQSQTWCNPDENSTDDIHPAANTHTHTHTHSYTPWARGGAEFQHVCLSVSLSVCVCVSRGRRWLSMTSVLSLSLSTPAVYHRSTHAVSAVQSAVIRPDHKSIRPPSPSLLSTHEASQTQFQQQSHADTAVRGQRRPFTADKDLSLTWRVTGLLGNMWTDEACCSGCGSRRTNQGWGELHITLTQMH